MTKKLLPKPVQSSSVTDKNGKPTSHHYRWMDGVNQSITNLDSSLTSNVATLNTSIATTNTNLANLQTTVTALTGLTRGTAQSGADTPNKTFTGIPSWVRRVSVVFSSVIIKWAPDYIYLQLGAGSIQTTGYTSRAAYVEGTSVLNQTTSALVITNQVLNGIPIHGSVTLTNISGNTWISTGTFVEIAANRATHVSSGSVTLSGTLDRVNLTTPGSGTSATSTNIIGGTMNIFYE